MHCRKPLCWENWIPRYEARGYRVATASMIAHKPESLTFEEAASAPIVAVTAWQMLFDYAKAQPGQSVLIQGAGGNVGAYAVQLACHAGLRVFATASSDDVLFVERLGAEKVVDYKATRFEDVAPQVDIVLDMVGGDTRSRSLGVIKPGGILVSVVSKPMPEDHRLAGIRTVFFLVEVTSERLDKLSSLFDSGKLKTQVGTVLPLAEARTSHEMLAGAPHKRGKIILTMEDS